MGGHNGRNALLHCHAKGNQLQISQLLPALFHQGKPHMRIHGGISMSGKVFGGAENLRVPESPQRLPPQGGNGLYKGAADARSVALISGPFA